LDAIAEVEGVMAQSNPGSKIETIHISTLRFLGEHDGPPERELKSRLIQLFRCEREIRKGYLAVVAYQDSGTPVVALCLSADAPSPTVVTKVGQIFHSTFASHQHLDLVFLSESQEAELAMCCTPFYCAGHSSTG
jgi:hypothetical protein